MNEENTIQSLWIGPTLPTMQRLSISSFLAQGHNYDLYVFEDVAGLPHGARLRDAREILRPPEPILRGTPDGFALPFSPTVPFSDRFRYRLLLERGGWWADADVVCLRAFSFTASCVFSAEHRLSNGVVREVPTITVMKAPAGMSFFEALYDSCVQLGTSGLDWNETGSTLLGKMLKQYSLNSCVQRAIAFCPLPLDLYLRLIDPTIKFIFEPDTYALHLWNEMWRREKLDPESSFDSKCLYEQLKQRFINGSHTTSEGSFIVE